MGQRDSKVDAYIGGSAEFAKPILNHLRDLVHRACPDVTEKIKWSFPNFEYAGSIVCSMAAFQKHCTFGFWKAALMKDDSLQRAANSESAMGNLGKIRSLDDLPADRLMIRCIKEAMKLNEQGAKVVKPKANRPAPATPKDLMDALKKNRKAMDVFEEFPPSHKREYIEWITEAKREETRSRRISEAVTWIADGKGRNWKYER